MSSYKNLRMVTIKTLAEIEKIQEKPGRDFISHMRFTEEMEEMCGRSIYIEKRSSRGEWMWDGWGIEEWMIAKEHTPEENPELYL